MQDKRTAAGGKRAEAAEQALADVLQMFQTDSFPEAVATTVIRRLENDCPCATWSLGNQLLCLLAGTDDARGFRQWKTIGRSVTKGARAFRILAPSTRKVRETDETTGEETERTVAVGFVAVPVFAIGDTEGEPIERPDYTPAALPPLFDVAERLGLAVRWLPFADRFLGYFTPSRHEIVLCTHDVRTYFHELAHAAHQRVLRARGTSLRAGQHERQEIVAETTAAVLCRLYGFDRLLARRRRVRRLVHEGP